jgi:hypothetical protein
MPEGIPQDVQTLVQTANTSALTVSQFQIVTAEDYQSADLLLRDLKEQEKTVKEKLDFLKAPSKEAIQRLDDFFKPVLQRIKDSKVACDQTMTAWRHTQEQLRKEEERRQNEIIEAKRQKELAEAAAIRAKADADAAELRRKAEEAAAAGNAAQAARYEQRAESKVEAAESRATVATMTAESLPPARVASSVPKIAGSYGRSKGWGARPRECTVDHPNGKRKLTSLEVLILAVAEAIAMGHEWPETKFLTVDQKALDSRADDLKEDFNIPGYESYWKGETTVSRKR